MDWIIEKMDWIIKIGFFAHPYRRLVKKMQGRLGYLAC